MALQVLHGSRSDEILDALTGARWSTPPVELHDDVCKEMKSSRASLIMPLVVKPNSIEVYMLDRDPIGYLRTYHSHRNQFERFRWFLELISRFEFDFRRCGFFLVRFEFLVC